MNELLRQLAANDFAAVEGLQVSGTLPIRQELVNEVITGLLRDAQAGSFAKEAPASQSLTSVAPSPIPAAEAEINWWKLIDTLQVRFGEGKLIVDFALRR